MGTTSRTEFSSPRQKLSQIWCLKKILQWAGSTHHSQISKRFPYRLLRRLRRKLMNRTRRQLIQNQKIKRHLSELTSMTTTMIRCHTFPAISVASGGPATKESRFEDEIKKSRIETKLSFPQKAMR